MTITCMDRTVCLLPSVRRREVGAVTAPDGSEQLRNVLAVTDTALAQIDVEDLLSELPHRIRSVLDVDTAAVLLRDRGSNELVARAACELEEEFRRRPGPGRHRIRRQHRETQVPGRAGSGGCDHRGESDPVGDGHPEHARRPVAERRGSAAAQRPNPHTPPRPRIPLPAKRKAHPQPTPELPSDQGAELVPG
jgi:hypothetical protein